MKVHSLARIAELVGGQYRGDGNTKLQGVASLSQAQAYDIAYIDSHFHKKQLAHTKAGAVLMTPSFTTHCLTNSILVCDPREAMAYCAQLFSPLQKQEEGIDSTACIGQRVSVGEGVYIGANVVIGDDVSIGKNCEINPGVVIENNVCIGDSVSLQSHVVIKSNSRLSDNVFIDYGSVVGAKPYNLFKTRGHWHTGPALGAVVIERNVHIGANTVIDRGSLSDTLIAQGVQIDNLVQVAHDVIIGEHTSIAGCAAIGAHSEIGSHCIIGGASTIGSLLKIADEVVITGMSAVSKSLLKSGIYSSGTMVNRHDVWRRNVGRFHRLDSYVKRLKQLEQQTNLEKNNE